MSSTFKAVSFVNKFNQTINVGDKVMAIASGYGHYVSTREATYLGANYNEKGEVESVKIEWPAQVWKWNSSLGEGKYIDTIVKSNLFLKRIYKLA